VTTTSKTGHDYPIRPGQRAAVCRVTILSAREEPAGHITYKDARAEGYKTTVDWKAGWVRQYDKAWLRRNPDLEPADLAERFDTRHATTPTVVLTLKLVTDEPRWLATQRDTLTGRCLPGGYTAQRGRAADDLEVVDPATQARITAIAAAARELGRMEAIVAREQRRHARLAMIRRAA
jgi:hypothetical protein